MVTLMDRLAGAGLRAWIGGGWGVDALVGRATRPHGDLDLAVDSDRLDAVLALLAADGFAVVEDWLPVRVEVAHADGRRVDVHPVRFAPDGSAVQPGLAGTWFHYAADAWATGEIGGRTVDCLSAAQQLRFRQGYAWRPVDHHDAALLRQVRLAQLAGLLRALAADRSSLGEVGVRGARPSP